jgi:hypothetical protein
VNVIDNFVMKLSFSVELYESCGEVSASKNGTKLSHSPTKCSFSKDISGKQIQLLIPKKSKSINKEYGKHHFRKKIFKKLECYSIFELFNFQISVQNCLQLAFFSQKT